MKQNTKPIGCMLTDEEFKQLLSVCARKGTYPSAALREAILQWMERNGG